MLEVFVLIVLVIVWFIFRTDESFVIPVKNSDMPIDNTDEEDKDNIYDNNTDDHVDDHVLEDTNEQLDVIDIAEDTDEEIDTDKLINDHDILPNTDELIDGHIILEDCIEYVQILDNSDEQIHDHIILEDSDEQLQNTNEQIDEDHTIENTEQADDKTPSVFIDEDLLSLNVKRSAANDVQPLTQYTVDGIVFEEKPETDQYRSFELYANYQSNMDESADHSGLSAKDDTPLQLYIQTAPNGMIINGNVFITIQQWHTLMLVSECTLSCAVCGVYCDEKHMELETHRANLELCKPLDKYDLSITRRIDSFYHCAVCNRIFHQSELDLHFSGKEHENNLLFAINKVSDIMYDFSVHHDNNNIKKDTYHYNARAINNDSIENSESDDDERRRYNAYGVKDSEDEDDEDEDEDDEDFYDNVEPPLSLACSYASMARKPKTEELPEVLEIDLGNKMVKVKFDSWNMVISPKENMFYCMVCTQYDQLRRKAKHCFTDEHLKKLAQCKVIEQYERYLVRQVDEKLYHCGHCNNLQLINEMEDHIETQHPPTKSTSHLDSPAKKLPNPEIKASPKTLIPNEHEKLVKDKIKHVQPPKMVNAMDLNMYHGLRAANSNLNEEIAICTFGKTVRIAKLAYNIVCGSGDMFYCGLCEISINKEGLAKHVHDLQHLILLQGTPFIQAFNIHLYRQIRDALHCALCNELIPLIPEIIMRHKIEPKHILSLGKALGQIRNLSSIEAQIKNETQNIKEAASKDTLNQSPKVLIKEVKEDSPVATIKDGKFDDDIPIVQTDTQIISTEFIEVKNGVKDEESELDESEEDSITDNEFDFEEYLHVRIGNCYIKITHSSYHTLVEVGDGSKYCFVCSVVVVEEFKKHVESRGHVENMEKYKFVDKYKEDLLRQIYLMYHCSICNVLISRKQVNHHLSWPTHVLQTENSKLSSRQRRNDVKAGTKQIAVTTQKENIYLNETETKIKIILNISIQKDNVVSVTRKNKIIIFNDNVLKISFDAWHSLNPLPNGWKCKMCQTDFEKDEFAKHVTSDWHTANLNKFETQYSPALIRKVNDTTLNCIMCNTEVSYKQHIVREHIQGKKHIKNYDNILKESSVANSYADCDEDVITL